MTSCKPPPTCIDASPIPDANDSRMSAIPYEANLTPMGVSPPRAPRTVRDTLASYGSRCSAIPMRDGKRLCLGHRAPPATGWLWVAAEHCSPFGPVPLQNLLPPTSCSAPVPRIGTLILAV